MANSQVHKAVTRQPKQLLWTGVVAGLLFVVLGVIEVIQSGSTYSTWHWVQEIVLILLAFAWAIDSITKLRALKAGQV